MSLFYADSPVSPRVRQGVERLSLTKKMYNFAEENIPLGDDFFSEAHILRRAKLYHSTLKTIKQPVYPNELIVGDVPYYEFKANRELMPPFLTPNETEALQENARTEFRKLIGTEPENFSEMRNYFHFGVNYGHIIADYGLLLNIGFSGMQKRIDDAFTEDLNKEERDFLHAAKLALSGSSDYIERYAEAEGISEEVAAICRHIAHKPPSSFHQALQLLWFMQLLMEIESGISAFSYGRCDQYLNPFLEADIAAGRIDLDRAQEIMDCFFIKNNEQNIVTNDAGRAITIGGITGAGKDGVNNITFLMLNSAIRLRLLQPKLNARVFSGSSEEYLSLCARGGAINAGVQIYNDEVIIKALENYGYPSSDAVDYGMIGCYEYGLAGIDRPSPMGGTFHLAACLEQALYDDSYENYDELEAAFTRRVAYWAGKLHLNMIMDELIWRRFRPMPLLSNFVGDCIKNAVDINKGGARYKTCGVRFTGFSAVADSLTAIKVLLFEKKIFTKDQLLTALKNNFEGNEALRLTLLNKAPKYGNNDDIADSTAVRLGEICCNEILKLNHIDGAKLRPGLFSFSNFMESGKRCGALPNGRRAAEPFVNGVSPMHGSDKNGPTAMLASAAKLNYNLSPNGTTLDLKLPASIYTSSSGYDLLKHTTKAYFNMGGAHIQAYTLSAEDLIAAKKEPEKYGNIIVRITGYSAHFVTLDEAMQDEIIRRTVSF